MAKHIITFTASMEIETNNDWNPTTFDEVRDTDYDNVDRPIMTLEDTGWTIKNKKFK